jgi:hypothetical protein
MQWFSSLSACNVPWFWARLLCQGEDVGSARFFGLLGDVSEILQSLNFVTNRFLAMDGSRQEQFPTPKIGV